MTAALLLLTMLQLATATRPVNGIVVDATGAPVAGADVRAAAGSRELVTTTTASDGSFTLSIPSHQAIHLRVSAGGFAEVTLRIARNEPSALRIVLRPSGISETIEVSASGEHLRATTPASATVLDREALAASPSWTLDDQLRSVPGFTLFRRSSSRVANPTTQGVTLRGLAASGASRTAVFADGIPLNDPFGGWVYWDRIPAASIERVEVARGGSSDLHGSDALGGAIRISTTRAAGARLWVDAGSHRSARLSAFGGGTLSDLNLFAAVERATTDGFVIVGPESRGSIDVPASSRYGSGVAGASGAFGDVRIEARGNYFDENRGNGTPFQTNATIVRQASGSAASTAFGASWLLRAFVASQDYDQTFSAVAADRESERPTSTQHVDSSSSGATFEVAWGGPRYGFVASGLYRRVNGELLEGQPAPGASLNLTRASQQSGGAAVQLSLHPFERVTIAAGIRGEAWHSELRGAGDDRQIWRVLPRASIVAQATDAVSVRAAVHRAYRTPTINELYRPFRVGNVLTQANSALGPEESLGIEGALLFRRGRTAARAIAFWTRLDDGIVNVTVSASPTLILRQRQNASRIRAAGVELEADLRLVERVTATAAIGLIDSVFVEGTGLDGLRVPQVPRWQVSAGLQGTWGRGSASLDWRFIGEQFDDDRNQFALDRSSMINARAGWRVRPSLDVMVAIENAFDEEQDVGRTPLRTIGIPRTARLGLRWRY